MTYAVVLGNATCDSQCGILWPAGRICSMAPDMKFGDLEWQSCILHLGKTDLQKKVFTRKVRKLGEKVVLNVLISKNKVFDLILQKSCHRPVARLICP